MRVSEVGAFFQSVDKTQPLLGLLLWYLFFYVLSIWSQKVYCQLGNQFVPHGMERLPEVQYMSCALVVVQTHLTEK